MEQLGACRRLVEYSTYMLGLAVLSACLLGAVNAHAVSYEGSAPSWTKPSAMAVKRVGPIGSVQHEPAFLKNLDCNLLDYRLTAAGSLQTGCFTSTAFGLLDSDNDIALFNGTDEGLPLLPYSAHQVLVPWPGALDLAVLDAANTGGSYISLYKNPLAWLRDQRNSLGELTAKQLVGPPDLILRDPGGKQLVINPQAMAFSDGGSWLVVETLSGSFVRINLATLDMVAFAPAFGSQGSPALLRSEVAVSDDGRYVAIGNDTASSLKVYDLAACGNSTTDLQPEDCASYDYLPFARQQIEGLQSVRHLRFVNDGLLSLEAVTDNPAGGGVYELAPQGSITSLIDYLGLGDSYTSGEGAFDYLLGTDTSDDMCHLSVNSYPLRLAHDLFGTGGGHSVACSGAVINDVGSTSSSYRGQVKNGAPLAELQKEHADSLNSIMASYLPGYVAQQRFVKQYQPAITTASIGGNDIGFGDILQKCVEPHVSLHGSANTCYSSYEDRLEVTRLVDRIGPRWTALYRQLEAEAPGTRLFAIGYPQIAVDNGNCALNVHLNKAELAFSEELIDYLNGAVRQAAEASGVTYVDISQALVGHRLCEAASYDVAVNGLTAGTDAGALGLKLFGKGSYHPNALGQALIEQAILKQTHNLAGSAPASSASTDSQTFLNVPKTGRVINTVVPDDNLAAYLTGPDRAISVQADGARDGLKPNTVYAVRVDGSSGPIVGTSTSNTEGNVSVNIKLPGDLATGEHTIDITGDGQTGEPIDVTQPIYIPVSDNDADGDGISDSLDTCPGAINSGQDSDQDGVDDSCDSLIGPTAATGGQQGSSGSHSVTEQVNMNDDGSRSGAGVLGEQPTTVVASLVSSDNQPVTVSSSGQILGKSNASRAPDANKALEASSTHKSVRPPRPLANLYVISWVAWAGLFIIIWMFIILGLLARRLIGRPAQVAYEQIPP